MTTAFENAAKHRSKALGLEGASFAIMPNPLASRTEAELKTFAENLIDTIARGLARAA